MVVAVAAAAVAAVVAVATVATAALVTEPLAQPSLETYLLDEQRTQAAWSRDAARRKVLGHSCSLGVAPSQAAN